MSAISRIDHLVYGTPDLERTVTDLERRLGMRAQEGGRHTGFGTRNAILSLGETAYLEVMGPDPDAEPPHNGRPFGIDRLGQPRLVAWSIAVDDLDATLATARRAGYEPGDILAAQRTRPDGEIVSFRIAVADITRPPGNGLIPFPIEWGDCEHPASGPPRVSITGFRAEHPTPSSVRPGLDALGVSLSVMLGSIPALIVTLEGPVGRVKLE